MRYFSEENGARGHVLEKFPLLASSEITSGNVQFFFLPFDHLFPLNHVMHNTHLLDCGCCRPPRCLYGHLPVSNPPVLLVICGLRVKWDVGSSSVRWRPTARSFPCILKKNIAAWPASLIRYLESKPRTFDASWRLSPSTSKRKRKKPRRYHHLNFFPTSAHRLPSPSHWVFFNLRPVWWPKKQLPPFKLDLTRVMLSLCPSVFRSFSRSGRTKQATFLCLACQRCFLV